MPAKQSVYKNSARKEYDITDEKRAEYRRISQEARLAKLAAEQGLHDAIHEVNTPKLDPNDLMPQLETNGIRALSLFAGGGGLDLGFDRAGYTHVASYELIPICKDTLKANRPSWAVYGGPDEGDVTLIDWKAYKGKVDLIQGGPPCQPFSIAGEQRGLDDERNMWGEFNRAVNTIKPKAFVAENVLGLMNPKFEGFVQKYILEQLNDYHIVRFEMHAADYGVPQIRRRVFFVGFKTKKAFSKFTIPEPTHDKSSLDNPKNRNVQDLFATEKPKTMGVREALGLPDIGFDSLAPTIRSAFTGKRNTTSVLNSSAGQKAWGDMLIWPNGVQADREKASGFPAKHDHFRLSVSDVGLLQGFPESWKLSGAVYQALGQIGNSVAPPVAYQVAKNVAIALS
ncbi:DNA cytosine methyltransferase [Reinekea marinisedimentorum]|uniref:Cytosine-specific methyltransferase n=1 Tax=Reinekea marinisedimentorum TaxID=230495 RepID=A0A4R3HXW6_9GAMM|nr:DNA (cytosine-5-)-methyltransferase [Reinekea marinisedimentorum]TCS37694.1 DNA (cytosine-5)-methyltransferase 1 [Reinekea marinisedimentorum]